MIEPQCFQCLPILPKVFSVAKQNLAKFEDQEIFHYTYLSNMLSTNMVHKPKSPRIKYGTEYCLLFLLALLDSRYFFTIAEQ